MILEREQIVQKQGRLAKDTDGNLVLINPEGKAYAVDNDLSTVWLMLDGSRTYQDLLETLCEDSPHSKVEIDHVVVEVLTRLKEVDLVTW